jgi:hypothetical protein
VVVGLLWGRAVQQQLLLLLLLWWWQWLPALHPAQLQLKMLQALEGHR